MGYRDLVISHPNLLSYWQLDDQTGSPAAADVLNASNGQVYGSLVFGQPGIAGCPFNYAAQFDGSTAYIDAGTGSQVGNITGFTVELWAKWYTFYADTAGHALVSKSSTANDGFMLYQSTSAPYNRAQFGLHLTTDAPGFFHSMLNTTLLNTNTWYHVVATYDGAQIKIYINGALDATSDMDGTFVPSSNNLFFGTTYTASGSKFNGVLDEIAVYNRALTADEISSHFVAGTTTVAREPSELLLRRFGTTNPHKLSTVQRKVHVKVERLGRGQILYGGAKVRDITAVKRTVSIEWEKLPQFDSDVIDNGLGFYHLYRDYVTYQTNSGILTLSMPDGKGGTTTMNCYVGQDSDATMWRRRSDRYPFGSIFWDVKLTLLEI